jgi:hypothetical protein
MARQQAKQWLPMERGHLNPSYMKAVYDVDVPVGVESWRLMSPDTGEECDVEVWGNDLFQATVERLPNGWIYISLKRHDRAAVRDWRHLQSIKNEVAGPEREAFELFPAESRLVDGANQYHLWVLPADAPAGLGFHRRAVLEPTGRDGSFGDGGKGRQRPWQPGLSTGPGHGDSQRGLTPDQMKVLRP